MADFATGICGVMEILKFTPGAMSIFAKCPANLPSNEWYSRKGFVLEGTETLPSGKQINLWRLQL